MNILNFYDFSNEHYGFIGENEKFDYIQDILNRWKIKSTIQDLLKCWNESQRGYHSQTHLEDLLNLLLPYKSKLGQEEYEALILVALYHDIIYQPFKQDNEEESAKYFMNDVVEKNKWVEKINQAILDTKTHVSSNELSEIFNNLDMDVFNRDYDGLLDWEKGIYKEYKSVGNEKYKEGRLSFLKKEIVKYESNKDNILKLIDYVEKTY